MDYKDLPEGVQGPTDDYPFDQVAEAAQAVNDRGGMVFQKFTCANCGNRLTMSQPNTFYTRGSCDQCGHTTDIREAGCNFLAVFPLSDEGKEAISELPKALGD